VGRREEGTTAAAGQVSALLAGPREIKGVVLLCGRNFFVSHNCWVIVASQGLGCKVEKVKKELTTLYHIMLKVFFFCHHIPFFLLIFIVVK